jgi:hypothetical protein
LEAKSDWEREAREEERTTEGREEREARRRVARSTGREEGTRRARRRERKREAEEREEGAGRRKPERVRKQDTPTNPPGRGNPQCRATTRRRARPRRPSRSSRREEEEEEEDDDCFGASAREESGCIKGAHTPLSSLLLFVFSFFSLHRP